jgi:ABC-type glycerol-3-phosphate transport system permease component
VGKGKGRRRIFLVLSYQGIAVTCKSSYKNLIEAWNQWLMPAILSTQEAEIRRIVGQSYPQQIVQEILSRKYPTQNRAGESGSSGRAPP